MDRLPEGVKRIALILLAFVLGTCMACTRRPPILRPVPTVRLGVVRPWALMVLASNWDTSETAVERGYCVTVAYRVAYPDPRIADSIYVVWSVEPAPTKAATMYGVDFHCLLGQPSVHTHPTQGGMPNCDPSKPDQQSLRRDHAPFAVVQCDRFTFRFYYPTPDD